MSSNQFRVRPDSQKVENIILKRQIDPLLFSVTCRLLFNQALIDLDLFNLYYNFWAMILYENKIVHLNTRFPRRFFLFHPYLNFLTGSVFLREMRKWHELVGALARTSEQLSSARLWLFALSSLSLSLISLSLSFSLSLSLSLHCKNWIKGGA